MKNSLPFILLIFSLPLLLAQSRQTVAIVVFEFLPTFCLSGAFGNFRIRVNLKNQD